ncbi:MAG: amidohydrolase family protein [Treponemataceae bacterium]
MNLPFIQKQEKYIFDSHMHFLTLKNICLSAYLSFVEKNKFSESIAAFSASDYIYKDLLSNFSQTISLISLLEQPLIENISLLNKDLTGFFEKHPHDAIITSAGIELAGQQFDKLVLSPLIMDFNYPKIHDSSYYNIVPVHSVAMQADEMLQSFHSFTQSNPQSKLIFRPFLGINPTFWKIKDIEQFLDTYFSSWSAQASAQITTWEKSKKRFKKNNYKNSFAGIKLYPPMNCDPYPMNKKEQEKMDLIYSFCEKKTIPITTHCDNQGFRLVDFDTAQLFTSPERWTVVLEKHPTLYLNFAHFGKQYTRNIPLFQQNVWQDKILELIARYPNVYTDTSFNGTDKNYWANLLKIIEAQTPAKQDIIRTKIMFGTDWPLSLSKIKSATEYWNNFKNSPLDDELKIAIAHQNPSNFHFRSDKKLTNAP